MIIFSKLMPKFINVKKYNKTKQKPIHQSWTRKSPTSRHKNQRPACSHSQEFHRNAKLIEDLIQTWACCISFCELTRTLLS